MAFNTPFKMWKRYEFNGGTADPCLISWPKGIKARGEIRHQYHHAIDIVPTILDVLGIDAPDQIKGYTQSHFGGVSMRYSFDDAGAKTARRTQFYSMLGSRGIWHDGWKAVTTHIGAMAWGDYANDTWELYHTDTDRSECHDLAAQEPGRLRDLVNLWHVEAGANSALPLDDRGPVEILTTPRPVLTAPRDAYVYYPGTAEVPEAQGVLFAHGSWFGGHALYVKDNRLHYVYNFVGATEQRISADRDIPTGEKLILSASFEKQGEDPPGIANGILSLYYGDQRVGEGRIKTQPGKFAIGGEGLCVGRDSGEAVTDDYPGTSPWRFTGGTIRRVQVNVSGKPYIDLEREAVAMMSRE
jgi:arylsulfatase